jgi:hypothetical protein
MPITVLDSPTSPIGQQWAHLIYVNSLNLWSVAIGPGSPELCQEHVAVRHRLYVARRNIQQL